MGFTACSTNLRPRRLFEDTCGLSLILISRISLGPRQAIIKTSSGSPTLPGSTGSVESIPELTEGSDPLLAESLEDPEDPLVEPVADESDELKDWDTDPEPSEEPEVPEGAGIDPGASEEALVESLPE